MITNIVLNIPHSSAQNYDADEWSNMVLLHEQVNEWTDWFTDYLFRPSIKSKYDIKANVFNHSRFYVDVEKLVDDDLENVGQGIIYTDFNGNKRNVGDRESLMGIYNEYIQSFAPLLNSYSLLIDCHSFPSSVNKDVQVCIGYNEDESKPSKRLFHMICDAFTDAGYKVGINAPYSNSLTPVKPIEYRSIMIEVNKSVYMNEKNICLVPGCIKFRDVIAKLYEDILDTIDF